MCDIRPTDKKGGGILHYLESQGIKRAELTEDEAIKFAHSLITEFPSVAFVRGYGKGYPIAVHFDKDGNVESREPLDEYIAREH